jgi:Spy/CpxP family protein refolding chaperone
MGATGGNDEDAKGSPNGPSNDFWGEVDALRQQIEELERHRHQVREQIRVFEERYRQIIASRNAELERLRAEVAAARSQRDTEAERRARQAAEVAARLTPKERHRSMVKRIHPDRASDEDDRAHRENMMKRINDALDRNDMEEFDWLETEVDLYSRDSADGAERESIRDRLYERLTYRASNLSKEIEAVQAQHLWTLHENAAAAGREGRDLLEEMAADIDAQIVLLREELDLLASE